MSKDMPVRRILIVDDQQEIHDTFDRIFSSTRPKDEKLSHFESRFLESDTESKFPPPGNRESCYELSHATSGRQAETMVRQAMQNQQPYVVAFVDMRMQQELDGMEITELLWRIDPNLHVVICTAYSDHIWDNVLDRLGRNDQLLLLRKPFESDEARQLALALSEKSRLAEIQRQKVENLGREIERRRLTEESMRKMAHRDPLTNLPNRPYLLKKLCRLGDRCRESHSDHHAVLFLDLDNFKIINDSLGHDAGDDLLKQVASRLTECVRQHDTTSRICEGGETVRLGGDEFVVLLERLKNRADAIVVAERIVSKITEPFRLCDRLVNVGTSVGIAFVDHDVHDAQEALRNADTAMYRAKNSGKGRVAVFDQTMHDDLVAQLELENELRTAIEHERFTLNYQPIVDLQTGNLLGIESLIRWTLADGRSIPPHQFIPIIEELGLIGRVGEWVLEQSMLQFSELIADIPQTQHHGIYLGVNVSRRQLSDPYFVARLEKIFRRTGFDRRRLKLEFNESIDLRDENQALQTMLDLHESGIGIQIDDFGKGHSSLTCFQKYPIEAVKIDRHIIGSIATDHSHAVIAQAIIQLTHHLNAKIIAAGVESATQLTRLRRWGCDAAQGFLFSPPLNSNALRDLMLNPTQSEGINLLKAGIAKSVTFEFDTGVEPFNSISESL